MEDDVDEDIQDDVVVGSKRTDRADKLLRLADVTLSVTKMKLNTFCKSPAVCQEIERCVQGVTRAAVEGIRLVNLHTLHLLATEAVIPKLDQTYFYRAFILAAGSVHPAAVQVFGEPMSNMRACDLVTCRYLTMSMSTSC
eukprot:NODE_510_length_7452_cov_0.223990.p4 type:complete len:140 gc:universal NODE_510_length_7452_cov_0.223990:4112-3693(-)